MPAYPLTGITSLPTGVLPVTGTPSGFQGPWLIETQNLTVEYARVPVYMTCSGGNVVSLSATNTRTSYIHGTTLQIVVNAFYSRTKSYESFSTSAYLQNQKFSILPEADAYGEYYGPASAVSATGIIGPAGTIITSQPYLRRVLWDDNLHTTTSINVRGTNVIYAQVNNSNQLTDCANMTQSEVFRSFQHGIMADAANTFISNAEYQKVWSQISYFISGPYALSKENSTLFGSFLTDTGNRIKNSMLVKTDPVVGTDITGIANNVVVLTTVGNIEYNPNRHDYS